MQDSAELVAHDWAKYSVHHSDEAVIARVFADFTSNMDRSELMCQAMRVLFALDDEPSWLRLCSGIYQSLQGSALLGSTSVSPLNWQQSRSSCS